MEVRNPVCCGIDVHKRMLVACLRRVGSGNAVTKDTREFKTTVDGLLELSTWLAEADCTVVAMESTGVYWRPVYHALSGGCEVIIGNAREIRQRPGRKTDKMDAEWIAELLAHGLISQSFVPPPAIDSLRGLTRSRVALVQTRTQAKNRVHKALEDSGIKLASVVSDLFGKSARQMLDKLVAGEREPKALARLAIGKLIKKIPQLELALKGQFTADHGFQIRLGLDHIDFLERQLAELDERITNAIEPLRTPINQLVSIPGVDECAARTVIAEIGTDMVRFGSDKRLASWAGMSPGNNESAGKNKHGRTRSGNRWLRRILTQCAWAARQGSTHLGKLFRRLEKRIGGKKAAIAVGHRILVVAFHLLKDGTCYDEGRYADLNTKREEIYNKLQISRLERAGYKVTGPEPAAVAT